ncbi:MAG: cytochrome C [Nitrospirota bacterium]|nr:MAG: cytochrome C [Nitrospirota bacterium]
MRSKVILVITMLMMASLSHADYKDVFEREFVHKPWVGARLVEEGVCVDCHTAEDMREDYLTIPQEWKRSIHFDNGVSCHDCHGGDPDDAAVSCGTPHSGFVGTPEHIGIPDMCGKCHIGIKDSFNSGGHGKALKTTGEGPNCVTCHGSHAIQKANIDIINQVQCQKCHSYERAKIMKQALFMTEKRIGDLEDSIIELKNAGASTEEEERALFRTHAEFRTLFHSIDVNLVKNRTDEFTKKLDELETAIASIYDDLTFRRNFSGFLLLLFASMSVIIYIRQKRP